MKMQRLCAGCPHWSQTFDLEACAPANSAVLEAGCLKQASFGGKGGADKAVFFCSGNLGVGKTYGRYLAGFFQRRGYG